MQWRRYDQGQKFMPFQALRPDLLFLAAKRFADANVRFNVKHDALPLSPLLSAYVQEGSRRQVPREAMMVACMLESDTATIVPMRVASAWIASHQEDSAAGHGSDISAAGQGSDNIFGAVLQSTGRS